jgi:pyruvate ferredoxin oxidoreductase gamma subunit
MKELRIWGRHAGKPPVKMLALIMGNLFLKQGKHVQVFDDFSTVRPGAPVFAILRLSNTPILHRACFNPISNISIVLDTRLFTLGDIVKGLRTSGKVYYLGKTDKEPPYGATQILNELDFDSDLNEFASLLYKFVSNKLEDI